MSKIFKELIGDFIVIAVDQLKGLIFSQGKDKNACCQRNEDGKKERNAKIICRSFLQG